MTNLIQMSAWSDSLGMYMPLTVIMPESVTVRPARVLYLLHGLSDDNTVWARRTSVEQYADSIGDLCVVMPTTHRSWYTNTNAPLNYWDYVSEELLKKIPCYFNVSSKREDTYVAGISMGGYGAVKLGLRKPENYNTIFGISGAYDLEVNKSFFAESDTVFGKKPKPEDDVFQIVNNLDSTKKYPNFHLFCGNNDPFTDVNKKFIKEMEANKLNADLTIEEGGHHWLYWDRTIAKVCEMIGTVK